MNIIGKIFRKIYIKMKILLINNFKKNVTIDRTVNFRKNFIINCSTKGTIVIGKNCFFNNDCSINAHYLIEIGDDCIFGEGVKIYDHNHVFNRNGKKIADQGFSCSKVKIGNNCWFGSNVIILAGADIGDNIVIGAGCIINSVIQSNMIVKNVTQNSMEPIHYVYGEKENE